MSIPAVIHTQIALNYLDEIGQGHSAAACHLDAALNAMGHAPKPVDFTAAATLTFEELALA